MGRELRRVPENWEHPKNEYGKYQPMFDQFYGDVLNEWLEGNKKWEDGSHTDLIKKPELKEKYPFFAMWHGDPPSCEYYQTIKYSDEELTHIQLYQTTSEGTPISPVFKADEFELLCEYASDHCTTFGSSKASKEDWMQMLGDGMVYHQSGNLIFI